MSVRSIVPLIACSASLACAPAVPKTSDNAASEGNLLEAFVTSNFTVFNKLEGLAIESGIDLESEASDVWPQVGEAQVPFGSSDVVVDFAVDRDDFSRIGRIWSVSMILDPLMADGQATEGTLDGTWTYWEEVEGDPSQSWVQMELTGLINHSGTAGEADTDLFAIVNADGDIWQANVLLGDDSYVKEP